MRGWYLDWSRTTVIYQALVTFNRTYDVALNLKSNKAARNSLLVSSGRRHPQTNEVSRRGSARRTCVLQYNVTFLKTIL